MIFEQYCYGYLLALFALSHCPFAMYTLYACLTVFLGTQVPTTNCTDRRVAQTPRWKKSTATQKALCIQLGVEYVEWKFQGLVLMMMYNSVNRLFRFADFLSFVLRCPVWYRSICCLCGARMVSPYWWSRPHTLFFHHTHPHYIALRLNPVVETSLIKCGVRDRWSLGSSSYRVTIWSSRGEWMTCKGQIEHHVLWKIKQ